MGGKLDVSVLDACSCGFCYYTAAGLTWEEAKRRCPEGVVPACHNAPDSVTISGPAESVEKFVAELQREGVFARSVDSSGVASHSYFMNVAAPVLKERLEKVGLRVDPSLMRRSTSRSMYYASIL